MEAAGERTPPKAAGGPAQNMSSATLSPESPAPSYPFWRVTKVPFPSMDRDGQTTHQQQQQQQQVFREDARLKFKRIARMLPYGGSTFHIAHSSRVPLDFEPGQIIIGVNKRGLHFFRPKPKKYLNSLALRDILYVRVQGRSLFISAEVNNGDHMDYEFDCATANQIHSAMAGYIEASDAGASSVGTPRSSVTIQNLGEPAPATDDHLQYRSSQAVPISMQEHEEAVAMAAGDAEARRPVAHKLVLGQENSGGATQRKSSTLTPATMKLNPPFNAQDYEGLSAGEIDARVQKEREEYYELKSELAVSRKLHEQAEEDGDMDHAQKHGKEVQRISAEMESRRQRVKVLKNHRRKVTKGQRASSVAGDEDNPGQSLAAAQEEAAELRAKLAESEARAIAVEQENEELGKAMAAFEEERHVYLKDIEKAKEAAEVEVARQRLSVAAMNSRGGDTGESGEEEEEEEEEDEEDGTAAGEEVDFLREELALAMGKAAFLEAEAAAAKKLAEERTADVEAVTGKLELLLDEQQELAAMAKEYSSVRKLYQREAERSRELFNQLLNLKGKVQVVARVRPSLPEIDGDGAAPLLAVSAGRTVVQAWKTAHFDASLSLRFEFDAAYGTAASQEDVFASAVPLVQSALDGNNVCLFSFGQSSSGKTYTMYGDEANPGLVPMAARRLFSQAKRDSSAGKTTYSVRCSMFEMTPGSRIVDLLTVGGGAAAGDGGGGEEQEGVEDMDTDEEEENFGEENEGRPVRGPKAQKQDLEIKMDPSGFVWVQGAVFLEVASADELLAAVAYGKSKQVAGNDAGSQQTTRRRHTVLAVLIEGRDSVTGESSRGKMTFVDLAGSERMDKSSTQDEALLREAAAINKSLSALGDVLSSLVSNEPAPSSESNRLTMLLSDSLGKNAKALMVVNLSPSALHAQETHSSLQYAARVRGVSHERATGNGSSYSAAKEKSLQQARQSSASSNGNANRSSTASSVAGSARAKDSLQQAQGNFQDNLAGSNPPSLSTAASTVSAGVTEL